MEGQKKCCASCLSPCGLGVAFGVLTALFVLVLGVLAVCCDIGTAWVTLISTIYIGYGASVVGILIGMVWGFIEGLICGVIVAWVYNFVVKRCPCKMCRSSKE